MKDQVRTQGEDGYQHSRERGLRNQIKPADTAWNSNLQKCEKLLFKPLSLCIVSTLNYIKSLFFIDLCH